MTALLFLPAVTGAAELAEILGNKRACQEGPIAQFGRYIGDWKIEDERLAPDGSGWGPGPGARWVFLCVGDGTAVQDFWMPNGAAVGTNLRTYNAETESWEIVWTVPSLNGFTHISATQNAEGDIVMDVVSPVQDPPRRITFLQPSENGWNWKMEWSFDSGASWTEVSRIKATPWKE